MLIAIAKDEAFNFTYRANIDALAAKGEIIYFSPMRDKHLPDCDLLYLPGGYPELFASQLSANESMRNSIKNYAERGGHIYAECGGFMYLCNDIDGTPMAGVLPMSATMQGARLHLGYRRALFGNTELRGHEFHYSTIVDAPLPPNVTVIRNQRSATNTPVPTELYHYLNVTAGYTHWYWAENAAHLLEQIM